MRVGSDAIWTVGLVLQLGLVGLLFGQRLAGRMPWFTGLIAFYCARTVVLFGVFGHVPVEAYAELYRGLSVADLVLQAGVAMEFATAIARREGRSGAALRGLMAFAGLGLIAVGATAAVAGMLPRHSAVPADRGTVFCGMLFVLLFGWSVARKAERLTRLVLAGMASVGVAEVTGQVGRAVSASRHDGRGFLFWAYLNAGAWLAAVIWWLVWCRGDGSAGASARVVRREVVSGWPGLVR